MKKVILAVLSLVVISLFLVGCGQDKVEVVDEEGNIVGEAFRSAGKYQIKTTSYCDRLSSSCGFVTKEDVYAILADTWGSINWNQPEWSCADTCREHSTDGNGKCVAGYGFDRQQRVMKDVLSCNIPLQNIGANSGPDLVCLCTG